jgi:hypothetical protein
MSRISKLIYGRTGVAVYTDHITGYFCNDTQGYPTVDASVRGEPWEKLGCSLVSRDVSGREWVLATGITRNEANFILNTIQSDTPNDIRIETLLEFARGAEHTRPVDRESATY